jgi:regulation of enolase protein 1 (concanavalin A-like superfamily)
LKTSVEFEPQGPGRLGAVVTNHGYSDWSTQDYAAGAVDLWLRVRREANDYVSESSPEGSRWSQIRMARLLEDAGTGQPVERGPLRVQPDRRAGVAAASSSSRSSRARV